jgi:hypothetical protein
MSVRRCSELRLTARQILSNEWIRLFVNSYPNGAMKSDAKWREERHNIIITIASPITIHHHQHNGSDRP